MKLDIIKLPQSQIELKIEVPAQEFQEFLDETARELSKDLKIEGFRPGHAPLKLAEERIGTAKILEEAAGRCVRKYYVKAILDNNIEAIGKPEISVTKIAKDNPLEFKAKVAVMPEVELPDYKKIAQEILKEKKEPAVKDEEIDKSIDWLQKSRAKYITVNRPCQEGDRVEIDFEGTCDGQKLPELCSRNHPAILGRNYFIPGFEQNLLGMKEGEEKEFSLTFPADFAHQHLAGKIVDFKTKINLVQATELPEINDNFAKSLGDFKDIATLRQSIKDGLLMEKENEERDRLRTKMLEKIAQHSKIEVPQILIESESARLAENLKSAISQIGLDFQQYLQRFQKTEADVKNELFKEAQEQVRRFLVLRQIAKQEKIEPSQEEVTEEVNKALKHFQTIKQAEAKVDIEQLKEYTKDRLKNEKVFQLLESVN